MFSVIEPSTLIASIPAFQIVFNADILLITALLVVFVKVMLTPAPYKTVEAAGK